VLPADRSAGSSAHPLTTYLVSIAASNYVSFSLSVDGDDLAWSVAARADTYDVARGDLGSLRGGLGTCLVTGVEGLGHTDGSIPAAGAGGRLRFFRGWGAFHEFAR